LALRWFKPLRLEEKSYGFGHNNGRTRNRKDQPPIVLTGDVTIKIRQDMWGKVARDYVKR